mmetsp:Transcript_933/g.1461  ORF Transcript_933/g.1461 Transcript_933/m.1461 type:complete len:238 (-) Transcript_933:39-752(-)
MEKTTTLNVEGILKANGIKNALIYALRNEMKEEAKLLIEKKVVLNETDKQGNTALHIAAKKGYEDIVQRLIEEKVAINSLNFFMCTPLYYTIYNGHFEIFQRLLKANAEVEQKIDGYNAFHLAVKYRQLKMVNVLATETNVNVDERDKNGYTPFHLAIMNNNIEMVDTLIKLKVNQHAKDPNQNTPCQLAIVHELYGLARRLLHTTFVQETNRFGQHALHTIIATPIEYADSQESDY